MKAVKFQFDRSFDEEAREAERAAEIRRERDLVTAKSNAHASGYEEGRATALAEIEAQTLAELEKIAKAANELLAGHDDLQRRLEERVVKLGYTIAHKFARQLVEAQPLAEVEALIHSCLEDCREEPRIVVRVHDEVADSVIRRIDGLKESAAFPGEIVVLGDPDLGDVTCRVEWADGGRELNPRELGGQIERTIQTYLASYARPSSAAGATEATSDQQDEPDTTAVNSPSAEEE